jgi:hypothetical protein
MTAASNVQAQQPPPPEVTNDAENAAAAAPPVAEPVQSDAPVPPPPSPPGAEGQWQWKVRATKTDRESLLMQGRLLYGQIEDLREERSQYGLAFPIVLMSVGGTLALVALSSASEPNCYDCKDDNSGSVIFGIGGLAMAIAGAVMLSNRVGPRRELATQIRSKESQLRSIEDRLRFSTMLGPHNLRGASLALSF